MQLLAYPQQKPMLVSATEYKIRFVLSPSLADSAFFHHQAQMYLFMYEMDSVTDSFLP